MTEAMTLEVSARIDDRGDIARITLVAPGGEVLPIFEAGAHLDIHLPEVDLWRQYSLCSDPAETGFYEIGVLKDPNSRGGSEAIHRLAQPGARLTVEGSRNHFPLNEDATRTVLFGGGIGITPMISMAHRLTWIGHDFTLHFCTRSERVTAYLDTLSAAPFSDRVVHHYDDGDDAQRLIPNRDIPDPREGAHLYVCGPQGFMDWLIAEAERRGYSADRIHREYFSADVDATGDSFEVEAQASGITVTVGPEETIAKVLAAHGVKIEVKCEEGVCGTCLTDVLDGEIDNRDQFLTEEEREDGDVLCACCSRGKGKLVLDI